MQGRASCPSKNNVRPIFKTVGVIFSGWDIFEEGHEALPCTGYAAYNYPFKCLIVNGAILPQQKSGEVVPVQGRASCPSKNKVRPISLAFVSFVIIL